MVNLKKSNKPSRKEKLQINRDALISAAAEVIGKVGYQKASIFKITDWAGLAHGTFYNYFEDRQELFDVLLPIKGTEVLDYIRDRVEGADSIIEMERRGLMGFQDYVMNNPWFFRLLHEARFASPKAHATHMQNLIVPFVRSLKRWRSKGQIKEYDDAQLETLAYLMVGAREYLFIRSTPEGAVFQPLTDGQLDAYLDVLNNGLLSGSLNHHNNSAKD